uniref:Uncharacterized protein n=1 Tax=viral metagenome TaxID=1070528 RepID=A0A6C0H491_9ZZZZ
MKHKKTNKNCVTAKIKMRFKVENLIRKKKTQ